MKAKRNWLILAGLVAVAGLLVAVGLNRKVQAEHFTAKIERGDINDVVEATGTINAVITVQVGSQVSGTIAKLNVDFNSRVHKGEVIALIDPALFQGALLQATADLANAKANVVAAKAAVEKAKASAIQAKADYERAAQLTKASITSQQQLDLAEANYNSANATRSGGERHTGRSRGEPEDRRCNRGSNQSELHRDSLSHRRNGCGA
jgi:HlyD family secretion protein